MTDLSVTNMKPITEPVSIFRVVFSNNGAQIEELVLGTMQQVNDYMITQSPYYGGVYYHYLVEKEGFNKIPLEGTGENGKIEIINIANEEV